MKHMLQGLWGVKEVQLLGRAEDFLQLFYRHSRRAAQIGENVALLRRLPPLWLEFLAVLGLASVVIAMLWRGLDIATIVPTLALFGAAAFRILPSVSKISGAVGQLRFTEPVIDNLYKEFQLEIPAGRDRRRGAAPHFRSDVRLEGVSFTYPSGHARALSDINFTIKRGDTVGIIGSSGSGKSTLVDVILGLFAPDGGRVTVDGKDIRDDLRAWQDQIGYVPQSIFLTDDSLRRNVAFGIPAEKVDEAAVERALKAAQLDEFVTTLPEGINTVVGERGIRLSGGQRQRIGIARALYHDPAVLVLDEATSALDTATEREFMRAVGALHGEKTILIVAHRLSTVAGCDWLLKLDSGRIVDRGPSREMLGADSDPGRPLDEPSSNVAHS
jgi:ABC-type multidrug transport system fused ATPase/permease subunit